MICINFAENFQNNNFFTWYLVIITGWYFKHCILYASVCVYFCSRRASEGGNTVTQRRGSMSSASSTGSTGTFYLNFLKSMLQREQTNVEPICLERLSLLYNMKFASLLWSSWMTSNATFWNLPYSFLASWYKNVLPLTKSSV